MKKRSPKISRREFLKKAAVTAGIVALAPLLPSCGGIKTALPDHKNLLNGEFMGIKVFGETEEDLQTVAKTILALHEMPEKLENTFGIKYDEPKELIEKFAAAGGTIAITEDSVEDNKNDGGCFFTVDKKPYILLNSEDALGKRRDSSNLLISQAETFHELKHFEQNKAGALFAPKTVSANDGERVLFEAERAANASEAEFMALASYAQTSENFSEKVKTKPKSDLLRNAAFNVRNIIDSEFAVTAIECKRNAAIDALNVIKHGAHHVENLNSKKAAIEGLSGDTTANEDFSIAYKPLTNKYAQEKLRHTPPDSPESTAQMEEIVEKIYSLDTRFNGKPIFKRDDPDHPLSDANNTVFKRVILNEAQESVCEPNTLTSFTTRFLNMKSEARS